MRSPPELFDMIEEAHFYTGRLSPPGDKRGELVMGPTWAFSRSRTVGSSKTTPIWTWRGSLSFASRIASERERARGCRPWEGKCARGSRTVALGNVGPVLEQVAKGKVAKGNVGVVQWRLPCGRSGNWGWIAARR